MSALVACCMGYGCEAMMPHLPRVWEALRVEAMAPAEPGVATLGEDMEVRRELAAAAAACLRRCLAALGGGGGAAIDALGVLGDAEVCGKLRRALSPGASGPLRSGSAARLSVDREVLCAVALLSAVRRPDLPFLRSVVQSFSVGSFGESLPP